MGLGPGSIAGTICGAHFAASAFTATAVHAASAALFAALFTTSFQGFLLLRADEVLHFFLGLFTELANLLLFLLRTQRRVGTNGLDLRVGLFFDLMVLLKSCL